MTKRAFRQLHWVWATALAGLLWAGVGLAGASECARVKMEIRQEVALTRQAFEGTMTVENGLPEQLTGVSVTLRFLDSEGASVAASSNPSDPNALFYYRMADGSSVPSTINAAASAVMEWLIIPSVAAGGDDSQGELYFVGATLRYTTSAGEETVDVVPDYIIVEPLPELTLDYFIPDEVYGDDPMTWPIEPALPFSLGVRVSNGGAGTAKALRIDSGQPKIIDNEQGLLIGFQIEGCEVNGEPAEPTLLADFGDIPSQTAGVARWVMTSSLRGDFVSFGATFEHADELGGTVTSVMTTNYTHWLVRDVLVDLPGRDSVRDFLAWKDKGDYLWVFESDNVQAEVADQSDGKSLIGPGDTQTLSGIGGLGFFYVNIDDPFDGAKALKEVVRADGKVLDPANAWLARTWDRISETWSFRFHLFDANNSGQLAYTVRFTNPAEINDPPVMAYPGDRILKVGQPFLMAVRASDPDGTTPAITAKPLPAGATFLDQTNGIGQFAWSPTTNQIGTYTVSFTASDGVYTDTEVSVMTVTTGAVIDAWKSRWWPNENDLAIIGNLADPDGDGLHNLLEYALDLDPTDPSQSGLPQLGCDVVDSKRYMTLTFECRNDDATLDIDVIASDSAATPIGSWTVQTNAVSIGQEGVRDGMERRKVRDSQAIEDGGVRRFLKLRVDIP